MARISQSTLTQIGGPDATVLTTVLQYPLIVSPALQMSTVDYCVSTYGGNPLQVPLNIANATITAHIIRRTVTNYQDTRGGLSFDLSDYPGATQITIPVTNIDTTEGLYNLVLDSSTWSISPTDPNLAITSTTPLCFTGYVNLHFAAVGSQPAFDQTYNLCFLVVGNGTTI